MLKSVYTYGGFWIGRYEAGIEGSITDVSKSKNKQFRKNIRRSISKKQ